MGERMGGAREGEGEGMGIADAACKYFIEIPNQIKVASSLQIQ